MSTLTRKETIEIAKANSIPVNNETKIIPTKTRYLSIPRLRNSDEDLPHNPITTWYDLRGARFALARFLGRLLHNDNMVHFGQYKITNCGCIHCSPYAAINFDTEQYPEPMMDYDEQYNILAVRENGTTKPE